MNPKPKRIPYTLAEELRIFQFLIKYDRHAETGGLLLWQEVSHFHKPTRTPISLWEHWRKKMGSNLRNPAFKLSQRDINKFLKLPTYEDQSDEAAAVPQVPQAVPRAVPQAVPRAVAQVPQEVPQAVPRAVPQVPQEVPQAIPHPDADQPRLRKQLCYICQSITFINPLNKTELFWNCSNCNVKYVSRFEDGEGIGTLRLDD